MNLVRSKLALSYAYNLFAYVVAGSQNEAYVEAKMMDPEYEAYVKGIKQAI